MENRFMKQPEYLKAFPAEKNSSSSNSIRAKALKQALDTRKFEIDLYWKRTAYFWAFIALVFTGYFHVLTHRAELRHLADELLLLCSALGLFLSACWFCVNKASKYWQENWERHVIWLEDDVMGPLYKRSRAYGKGKASLFHPTKPYPFSVSKINQVISFAVLMAWGYLFIRNIIQLFFKDFNPCKPFLVPIIPVIVLIVLVVLFCLLFRGCRSHHYKDAPGEEDEFVERVTNPS